MQNFCNYISTSFISDNILLIDGSLYVRINIIYCYLSALILLLILLQDYHSSSLLSVIIHAPSILPTLFDISEPNIVVADIEYSVFVTSQYSQLKFCQIGHILSYSPIPPVLLFVTSREHLNLTFNILCV